MEKDLIPEMLAETIIMRLKEFPYSCNAVLPSPLPQVLLAEVIDEIK